MPADFLAALHADEAAHRFFDALPNGLQRYHVDNVNAAKTPETRHRRIDKAVTLFRSREAPLGTADRSAPDRRGTQASVLTCGDPNGHAMSGHVAS